MSLPPIECIYVTEDCIREWKSGNPALKVSEPVPSLRFLYELCWTMVRGELPFQKCKVALDSVIFSDRPPTEKLASNFADIVTQMAQDDFSDDYSQMVIPRLRICGLEVTWRGHGFKPGNNLHGNNYLLLSPPGGGGRSKQWAAL
ncbi:THO complex subunit 2 [Stylosanthes scabra]|uniref:THO complex subunit 2 n=1 Tax=Stylosanthes scabra TaxID=79078 RepID=A0ABU6U833_9FABA|nr:THO complex subunit 2 [Stylosanthes scabra]